MSKFPWKTMLAGLAIVGTTVYAFAQMPADMSDTMAEMHRQMTQGRQNGTRQGGPIVGPHGGSPVDVQAHHAGRFPVSPGQDAFGAIQEVVQILEADPATDWSKVNIGALREHLIDMNEVTLHAAVTERMTDTSIEIAITGEGRTRDAIKRMVPAHVHELESLGWKAGTADMPDGVTLIVMANDAVPLAKLKDRHFDRVWMTTPGAIADHCIGLKPGIVPGS